RGLEQGLPRRIDTSVVIRSPRLLVCLLLRLWDPYGALRAPEGLGEEPEWARPGTGRAATSTGTYRVAATRAPNPRSASKRLRHSGRVLFGYFRVLYRDVRMSRERRDCAKRPRARESIPTAVREPQLKFIKPMRSRYARSTDF